MELEENLHLRGNVKGRGHSKEGHRDGLRFRDRAVSCGFSKVVSGNPEQFPREGECGHCALGCRDRATEPRDWLENRNQSLETVEGFWEGPNVK